MICLLVGNQLPVIFASSLVMPPPRPNIAATSQVILGCLVAFTILFSAINAHSIQLSMLYKLKKSTKNYLSLLLVAYIKERIIWNLKTKECFFSLLSAIFQFCTRVTHFVVYFCSRDNFFTNMVSLNLQLLTRFFFSAWCYIYQWLAVDKYAQIQHPLKNCRKRLSANLESLFSRVSFICGQILKYTFLCVWLSQKFLLYQKLPHAKFCLKILIFRGGAVVSKLA